MNLRVFLMSMSVTVVSSCVEECAELPAPRLVGVPRLLSETGLFVPLSTEALGSGVLPYAPRFELWSDGASKRRWFFLPPGATIDSSNSDFWRFPVGTRLWKEFSLGGVRLETRMLEKRSEAEDDWLFVTYAWNAEQTDATLLEQGATSVLGTSHTIPAAKQCIACHGGSRSRVLGFSAIQLAGVEGVSTRSLFESGRSSHPPSVNLTVPGDETAQAALGYLHANCSHCHNLERPPRKTPQLCYDPMTSFDFTLRADALDSVASTRSVSTMRSAHSPGWKMVLDLMKLKSVEGGMPMLGKAVVDEAGVAKVTAFVESL